MKYIVFYIWEIRFKQIISKTAYTVCSSFDKRISCSTVSNAFCKSTKIPQPIFPSSRFFLIFLVKGMIENQSTLWTILPKAKRSSTFLLKLQLIDPIFVFHLYWTQGKSHKCFWQCLEVGYVFLYKVTEGIAIIYQMWFLEWCKGILHLNIFTF